MDTKPSTAQTILAALRRGSGWICNECFNLLPSEQRGGRGARPCGWLAGDEIKVKCCKCKRDCYALPPGSLDH